jgi:hypothetical protein
LTAVGSGISSAMLAPEASPIRNRAGLFVTRLSGTRRGEHSSPSPKPHGSSSSNSTHAPWRAGKTGTAQKPRGRAPGHGSPGSEGRPPAKPGRICRAGTGVPRAGARCSTALSCHNGTGAIWGVHPRARAFTLALRTVHPVEGAEPPPCERPGLSSAGGLVEFTPLSRVDSGAPSQRPDLPVPTAPGFKTNWRSPLFLLATLSMQAHNCQRRNESGGELAV